MTAPPPPAPKSLLGRHRQLAPTAAVKVSPIQLGAMNFGDAWKDILGECSKENTFAMLDYFYEQGGNFIDTAVNYQANQSEQWIGEWMEKRGNRDEMVIATKFTGSQTAQLGDKVIQSNYAGNSAKNIQTSVERSLKHLKTDYIDLYYIHVWEYTTSVPELMQTLNSLVQARKVIYLGVSDTPAWVVVKCNDYAREHGLRQFSVYQGRWSAAERDFERDIIPMCKDQGMALAPWGALGGGYFKTKEQLAEKQGGRNLPISKSTKEGVTEILEKIAKKKNTAITSVALAYVMHKAPYVFPICGGRKVEHLKGNIEALGLRLTDEEIEEIETGYSFDIGFPHNFLSGFKNVAIDSPEQSMFGHRSGYYDWVVGNKPIPPHQGPLDAQFQDSRKLN